MQSDKPWRFVTGLYLGLKDHWVQDNLSSNVVKFKNQYFWSKLRYLDEFLLGFEVKQQHCPGGGVLLSFRLVWVLCDHFRTGPNKTTGAQGILCTSTAIRCQTCCSTLIQRSIFFHIYYLQPYTTHNLMRHQDDNRIGELCRFAWLPQALHKSARLSVRCIQGLPTT